NGGLLIRMSQVQVLQGEPHSRKPSRKTWLFSFEQKLTLFSIAANSTSSPDHPHKVKASLSYLDSTHP
ncbi:hypothetical protein, partial [Vibrio splendidus]|uniref:hypothetical protein n=1 Tax=Vibrio splendidus TaxID=29497 RepID=UPI00352C19B7